MEAPCPVSGAHSYQPAASACKLHVHLPTRSYAKPHIITTHPQQAQPAEYQLANQSLCAICFAAGINAMLCCRKCPTRNASTATISSGNMEPMPPTLLLLLPAAPAEREALSSCKQAASSKGSTHHKRAAEI